MGATPSHEDDGDEVEDSDDDDEVIRMQRRYRVSVETYRINCMNSEFFFFHQKNMNGLLWIHVNTFHHIVLLVGCIFHLVTFMELCFQNQFPMKRSSFVSKIQNVSRTYDQKNCKKRMILHQNFVSYSYSIWERMGG